MGITVVPVSVIKGLELDGVVVVEPADIVAGEQQGLRALYVALTRSTKRLTVVHSRPLPASHGSTIRRARPAAQPRLLRRLGAGW
jgi:superfamily I DNA/RNA helicase